MMTRPTTSSAASRPATAELKNMSVQELEATLGTTADGLTSEEARRRLEEYGFNEITERKTNPLVKFLSYFWGPIP